MSACSTSRLRRSWQDADCLGIAFKIQELSPECSVFWVPAIDTASFEQAYRKIGQQLRIPSIGDDKAGVRTCEDEAE
jgi:hypothetical protein